MGTVYLAEQGHPLRRRVALKVIKIGMDTREVVARFESERQALALMTHPNIAKVFDAGRADDGRPFFVMEYVPGVPITEYCDQQRLTNRSRLELIIPVCEALHHAHQKGIVHRDVKPSNILVSVQDGRPVPRIIDFGIAKALNQRLAEATVFTQIGLLIGTPEYMSPEQAGTNALDIDTTSDVYSLGVVLYQLLVGALPFEAARLRGAGYDEIRRIIREEDVVRPSKRLTGMGDQTGEVSRLRQTDPRALYRELRGDMDWVILKAMEKDRTRRYASASEFAADIRRHLADEPVIARPPSGRYRMRKLLKRRRGAVLSVLLLIAALGVGLAATLFMYWQARAATVRAQREAYVATIRAADLSLRSGALAEARHQLEFAAPELRGWEWGHLALRTDSATRVLTTGQSVHAIVVPDDDRIVAIVAPERSTTRVGAVPLDSNTTQSWRAVTWDNKTIEPVGDVKPTLPQNTVSVPVALSPDGKLLVTDDQTVIEEAKGRRGFGGTVRRVYDLVSGKAVAELGKPTKRGMVAAAFSPDGRRIAVGTQPLFADWSADLQIWDLHTLQSVVVRRAVHENSPSNMSFAFSSQAARLAFVLDGFLYVQDRPSSGRIKQVPNLAFPDHVALNSDGSLLFAVAHSGHGTSGQLFDATSGRLLGTIGAGERWSTAVFSPDDRLIAAGTDDGTVRVFAPPRFDTPANLQVHEGATLFGHRGPVRTLVFSPDGTRLVSGSTDGTARVWTAPYRSEDRLLSAPQAPLTALSMSQNGQIASAEGRTVRVWDLRTGATLATIDGHDKQVTSIALSPDASQLVSAAADGQVRVWSVGRRTLQATFFSESRQVNAVGIDPGGSYVASADADQKIRIWNPRSHRLIGVLEGHTAQVTALTVSPDGEFIVSGSDDRTIRIWDVRNQRVVRTLTGHTAPICSVVVSPDGNQILSSSRDHTLRVWSFNAGSELAVLRGHASDVTAGAFNSDGTRIISGSSDRTVRVWDSVLGVPLLTLSTGEHLVSSVLFGPDNRVIVSASFGGVFHIWESVEFNSLPNQQAGPASQGR